MAVDHPNELKTLHDLGLTLQQAKVYLALARIGQASMKELSEAADMDRGECYRIVPQLLEKRLISKVLASPIKYQIISFQNGVKSLLEKKKNDFSALEENSEKMLEKVKVEGKQDVSDEVEESILFVPMTPLTLDKLGFVTVQKSIDVLADLYRCKTVGAALYSQEKRALNRGVIFRMLVSDQSKKFSIKQLPHIQEKLMREPSFSLRVTYDEVAAPIAILDKKEVEIYVSKETHIDKSFPLVSNNERIVKLVQRYFDNLWEEAREIK